MSNRCQYLIDTIGKPTIDSYDDMLAVGTLALGKDSWNIIGTPNDADKYMKTLVELSEYIFMTFYEHGFGDEGIATLNLTATLPLNRAKSLAHWLFKYGLWYKITDVDGEPITQYTVDSKRVTGIRKDNFSDSYVKYNINHMDAFDDTKSELDYMFLFNGCINDELLKGSERLVQMEIEDPNIGNQILYAVLLDIFKYESETPLLQMLRTL